MASAMNLICFSNVTELTGLGKENMIYAPLAATILLYLGYGRFMQKYGFYLITCVQVFASNQLKAKSMVCFRDTRTAGCNIFLVFSRYSSFLALGKMTG